MKHLLVFGAVVLIDIVWTKYIAEVGAKRAAHAAFWSALIIAIGAFTTLSYVEDRTTLIPAIVGAFVGTYLAVWFDKRKEQK